MKPKNIIFLMLVSLAIFLFLPSISANGLQITNSSIPFQINKIYNQDAIITFDISNQEPFSFFNISFEDNPIIEMNKIAELLSGETREVEANIITNENFNGTIKIRGFYLANIGISNQTHEVEVNFDLGINKCNFVAIKGDTVLWINQVPDAITLRNEETGNDVTIIEEGQTYQTKFESPEIFKYFFLRRGFPFTNVCTITVLDSEGYINNPELDTPIKLDINVEYEPTEIEVMILTRNYTLDFTATQDGILSITNIGDKIAKNIYLDGQWFSFFENKFNLLPGYTKNVGYSISPSIFITNQTNKLYKLNITIEGNFPTITEQFDIFINHAIIDNEDYQDSEDLIAFITRFCNENPEICNTQPQIIYRNSNFSDNMFNASMSEQQLRELFKLWFEKIDSDKATQNWLKELLWNQSIRMDNIENSTFENSKGIDDISDGLDANYSTWIFLGMLFTTLIICAILYYIITYWKKKKQMEDFNKY